MGSPRWDNRQRGYRPSVRYPVSRRTRRCTAIIHLGLLLLFVLLTRPAGVRAEAVGLLPSGHWNGSYDDRVRVCLDILPQAGIRLTIYAPEERNPLVIDGTYKLAAGAAPAGKRTLTMTVSSVRTKDLSKCRKYWIVVERESTSQLGVVFRPGAAIKLTVSVGCKDQQSTVQLCVVAPRGTKTCRDLRSDETAAVCQPSPLVAAENELGF